MASTCQSASFTHPLSHLEAGDIGSFIGKNGSSLKRFVYFPTLNQYKKTVGDDTSVKLTKIKIDSDDSGVFAEIIISYDSSDQEHYETLTNIVVQYLTKHENAFVKNKSKPKVVTIVFKTHMEKHHIAKFIGSSGKNIKKTKSLCEEKFLEKSLDVTSFRVNICEDRFLRKGSYNKLFFIKNDAPTDDMVLITVSCIYDGHPNNIFREVKPIITDSIINMFPKEEQISSVEVDFLEDTCEISLEVKGQASAFLDNMDSEEPVYEPESPTYEPLSPSS